MEKLFNWKSVAAIAVLNVFLIVFLMIANGCSSTPTDPNAVSERGEGCDSPVGFIPEGRTKTGYRQAVAQGGMNCEQGELSCQNGQWSGPFIYPSCVRQQ